MNFDPVKALEIARSIDVDAYCDKLAISGTEHAHQRALFGWLQWWQNMQLEPLARMAYAVPNGGERNPVTAARLKAEGVKSGVPDVCWPVPRGIYAGLYVEMKIKGGSVSDTQKQWRDDLRAVGYAAAVCWGWRCARQCFLEYAASKAISIDYR